MKRIALLVLVAGCIDVSAHQIAPGRFLVEAEGKPRHSLGDVLGAAHERAAELCGGATNYTAADSGSVERNRTNRIEVALTVQCSGTTSAAR